MDQVYRNAKGRRVIRVGDQEVARRGWVRVRVRARSSPQP
jgi:hypothetical protein